MTTKGERNLLGDDTGRLTAVQRGALELVQRNATATLGDYTDRTIDALLERGLIDRLGRRQNPTSDSNRYVLTDLGRTVLALRTRKTGRARR